MTVESRMQSIINHGTSLMCLPLLALILIASSAAQRPSETRKPHMSKNELKTLLSKAKTAEDHQEIATCFAQQAQTFVKKSREYQARCAEVAEHPMNYPSKYPSEYDRCRFLEQYYALKSSEAEKKANLHEQLAKALRDEQR
jgi:hypothetical protein